VEGPEAGGLNGVDERLVSLLAPGSSAAEQYRALRNVVEQLRKTAPVAVVGITSPAVGDGKTVTATNLAGALAQAPGARVLLIEADLRRPTFRRYLGLDQDRAGGLVNLILDPQLSLADAVTTCAPFGLEVLPAGRVPGTPYELLKSFRFAEVLDQARAQFDYVILDTPPCLPVPDCRVIEKHIDGFFVVVSAHRTPRKLVEEALRTIEASRMLGVIFNEDDSPTTRYYRPYRLSANGDGGRWWGRGWSRRVDRRVGSSRSS
jgi:capsular exopolysaccharide synthesis family protein